MPKNHKNLLDDDLTSNGYERTLMYAVEAASLADIKTMGLGDPTSQTWKDNLVKNHCKKARIFIPINWTGGADLNCAETTEAGVMSTPMVKSVRVNQEEGVVEVCDGSGMAIKDTYYLEVLIMNEIDSTYELPSDSEVKLAKEHGYVL